MLTDLGILSYIICSEPNTPLRRRRGEASRKDWLINNKDKLKKLEEWRKMKQVRRLPIGFTMKNLTNE